MVRRRFILCVMLVWVLGMYGCTLMDALLMPQENLGGRSRLQAGARAAAPYAGPWGELAIAGAWFLQNVYLGGRKYQAMRKRKSDPVPDPAN